LEGRGKKFLSMGQVLEIKTYLNGDKNFCEMLQYPDMFQNTPLQPIFSCGMKIMKNLLLHLMVFFRFLRDCSKVRERAANNRMEI